jgi:hypothetical protein
VGKGELLRLKSQTRIVVLTKWFPPNDELAVKVARLCILREDFLLEMTGVYTEDITELDASSAQWRKIYFIRNIFRTLTEITGGIRRVIEDPEFVGLLAKQTPETKQMFADHKKKLGEGLKALKDQRDAIGAHVQESIVRRTLNGLNGDLFGLFEIGKTSKESYFKFASELVMQAMVAGVPAEEKLSAFRETNGKIANLFPAFSLIEQIVFIYVQGRHLIS